MILTFNQEDPLFKVTLNNRYLRNNFNNIYNE